MKDFASLYFWYESLILKVIRISLFLILFLLAISGILSRSYPNFSVIPFFLFLMVEIFFHFKVARLLPKLKVEENNTDVLESLSLEALGIFQTQNTSVNILKELSKLSQVKFIIFKSNISEKELDFIEIDKKELLDKALSLAKELKGTYITSMDLFVSYLLISEEKTKLLFNKKLKEEDIKNILIWAKNTYKEEELPKGQDVTFAGEGVAEDWIYGWTVETQKYMLDLSKEFLREKQLPIGRQNEYKQLIEALSKNGSVILVGDVGSGKESLVKQLAIESFMGKLSGNLFHQKIFQLMVDAFMAGAETQGEIQSRLNLMIEEVTHSGNVVMYIPEFQNIVGSSSFHLDISGGLIPYLKKGNIKIVAAVTPGAYKRFIEPNHSLLDSFTVINFDKLPRIEVLDMLFKKTEDIENKNGVNLTYNSIISAYEYADKYAKEKVLPGSAVVLLEDTANAVKISGRNLVEEQDILDQIQIKTKVSVGEPKKNEKELLLNLEKELHKRVIAQDVAVSALAESIRRLRTGLKNVEKPISFLFLGPTGVGKTETAKALADIYFGNGARLVRLDMSEFAGEDGMKRLLGSGPGQGEEKGQLTEPIYDSPYSLVLLDEFEKADNKILDLFLQVFDDGRLTDNKGKTVSFANTIIIATSNAASELIREEIGKGTKVDKQFKTTLLNNLQEKGIFKPELLNRFDDIIIFKPLEQSELTQIVRLLIDALSKNLLEKDIKVTFEENVIAKIVTEGFDKDFGARPMRRYVQDNIENIIAQKMLKDEIKRGDKIEFSLDSSNNIIVTKV